MLAGAAADAEEQQKKHGRNPLVGQQQRADESDRGHNPLEEAGGAGALPGSPVKSACGRPRQGLDEMQAGHNAHRPCGNSHVCAPREARDGGHAQ